MYKRTKAIDKYYINLEYENRKKEALMKIATLSQKLGNFNKFPERLLRTALLIEDYSFLFKSVCKHVDVVTTMIEYLTKYGIKMMLGSKSVNKQMKDETIISLLLTILDMCNEEEMHSFFEHSIIKNSGLEMKYNLIYTYMQMYKKNVKCYVEEMILLEDSDLYAVINCLKIIENSQLQNIWVQESIKQEFLSLKDKYFCHLDFHPYVYTFQSRKELLTQHTVYKTSVVSIWSEDIIAAKSLAFILNRDIAFINTHMDFRGGILLFPYKEIYANELDAKLINDLQIMPNMFDIRSDAETVCLLSNPEIKFDSIYNLFYDGMWQKPVKGMYWKYNNNLWANATRDDIAKCVNSAKKGFEIWSTRSVDSKLQVLSMLASILENNGKSVLATIVFRWIKFLHLCERSQGLCSQNEKVEIIKTRKPKGVIILKEENESVLFFRLMPILIAGNSVIVMYDENFCNLTQYCNIFATCKIPPGVINVLSSQNIPNIELMLCVGMYKTYAKRFFSKGTSKEAYTLSYLNLTLPKQIILPLK